MVQVQERVNLKKRVSWCVGVCIYVWREGVSIRVSSGRFVMVVVLLLLEG